MKKIVVPALALLMLLAMTIPALARPPLIRIFPSRVVVRIPAVVVRPAPTAPAPVVVVRACPAGFRWSPGRYRCVRPRPARWFWDARTGRWLVWR